jgi:hypothetical protein
MTGTPEHDDDLTEENRMLVARVRDRAAASPGAAQIAGLMTEAAAKGGQMSAEEIRGLAREALAQAQQVSFLLGRLAGLLDEEGGT